MTIETIPSRRAGSDPAAGFPISLLGEGATWFDLERAPDGITILPRELLPRRCTIRPVAVFQHNAGYPDLKSVMGRIAFANGTGESQVYRPYSGDRALTLRELFIPVETSPEDDRPQSRARWAIGSAIMRRLTSMVDIDWAGLTDEELDAFTRHVAWPDYVESCALHALAQSTSNLGSCVVEIGSFQGCSATVIALALRRAGSASALVSIDPHDCRPHNAEHVRLALRHVGEEDRLVQIRRPSDEARVWLRDGSASMVFIDGDHGYEQVCRDFENYRSMVAPGGCLVFHDFGFGPHNGLPEAHPGVRQAVEAHVLTSDEFKPLLLAHTLFAFRRVG